MLVSQGEPKPTDEGSWLYLQRLRERLHSGAVRRVIWCCTQDQLAGPLTKELPEEKTAGLLRVLREGQVELSYACLSHGKLLDAHKGLPAPKTQRDPAAQQFCEAYHAADRNLAAFTEMLL